MTIHLKPARRPKPVMAGCFILVVHVLHGFYSNLRNTWWSQSNLLSLEWQKAACRCGNESTRQITDLDNRRNDTVGDSKVPDSSESIKMLFRGLPLSNDPLIQPLILKNFFRRQGGSLARSDIVLATQMGTSKFNALLTQLQYWNGPASVAIYVKTESDIDQIFNFTQHNKQALQNTSLHLVMERTTELKYPHNILRNVATEGVESDFFLAMDVDLIPLPANCHNRLHDTMAAIEDSKKRSTLFVLPSFSLLRRKNESVSTPDRLPLSKSDTVEMVKKKEVEQFWARIQGIQGPTQYMKWMKNLNASSSTYNIQVKFRQTELYEPYVVAFKPGIPRYLEEFRGFGLNKISFFRETYRAGYRYSVLNDFYCVHLDHPKVSSDAKQKEGRANEEAWKRIHQSYMLPKYGK
mmetsp:Transcript_31736/g.53004  ORF Transcript_31736/g.53004 Transcript_31736/m.53004 type:complete len:408 (+) Transcript_31736:136-1359(+)